VFVELQGDASELERTEMAFTDWRTLTREPLLRSNLLNKQQVLRFAAAQHKLQIPLLDLAVYSVGGRR
jgi:hypothetical protein